MRISSPPTTHSCFYGIATPEREQLLASHMSVEEMAQIHRRRQPRLPLDRRALPRHGREAAATRAAPQFCDACFTGDYPIPLVDHDAGKVSTQLSLLTETV